MEKPELDWKSGDRLMCLQDCVSLDPTERTVLYSERNDYVIFDNLTILADNGLKVSFLQSKHNLHLFFIKLTD